MNYKEMSNAEFIPLAFDAVGLFHKTFNHPTYNPNNPTIRKLGQELIDLRLNLILEEWQETVDALMLQDKEQIADGLGDMLVVALGACHCLNMAPKGVYKDLPDNSEDVLAMLYTIGHNLKEENLGHVVAHTIGLFLSADICMPHLNLKENFFSIHGTNMSKLFDSKEQAEKDCNEYIKEGVLCGVYSKMVDDTKKWMIRRTDGKVLKPREWKPPVIKID